MFFSAAKDTDLIFLMIYLIGMALLEDDQVYKG